MISFPNCKFFGPPAILLALVLIGVVLGSCIKNTPQVEPAAPAALSAPSDSDVVAFVWVYRDGSERRYELVESTPVPLTATPTATITPLATVTLPPTNTPRPSNTPDLPQPTQEWTPVPTVPISLKSTQVPPEYGCKGTVNVGWLNVRSLPDINSGVKGSVRHDSRVVVIDVVYIGTDVWLSIRASATLEGWAAGYYQGVDFVTLDFSDECKVTQWGTDGGSLSRGVGGAAMLDAIEGSHHCRKVC